MALAKQHQQSAPTGRNRAHHTHITQETQRPARGAHYALASELARAQAFLFDRGGAPGARHDALNAISPGRPNGTWPRTDYQHNARA